MTREPRSPSARRREASVRRVIGRRETAGDEGGHQHGHQERDRCHQHEHPGDGRERVGPAGVRVGERHAHAPVLDGVETGDVRPGGGDRRVAQLPARRVLGERHVETQGRVGVHGQQPVDLLVGEPEPQPDVRVRDPLADKVQAVVVDERRPHGGVELQLAVHVDHHAVGAHRVLDVPVEDRGGRGGLGLEALFLLDAEVVVQAVDHDRGHEDQGQGDDAHERDGQPGLERLRDAGSPRRAGLPRPHLVRVGFTHVSAQRTGSPHPAPSARTGAARDRPRSSPGGG